MLLQDGLQEHVRGGEGGGVRAGAGRRGQLRRHRRLQRAREDRLQRGRHPGRGKYRYSDYRIKEESISFLINVRRYIDYRIEEAGIHQRYNYDRIVRLIRESGLG